MIMICTLSICLAIASAQPREVVLDEWCNRQTIKVSVDEKITIQLECRPGTGYRWHEKVSDKAVLVEREPPKFTPIPAEKNDGEPGGMELHVFRYVAKKPGTARFSAVYTRGPGTDGTGLFEVSFVIKERP
jgi:predicted secreted protein